VSRLRAGQHAGQADSGPRNMGVTAEPTAAGGCLSGVKLARLPAEDLDEESSAWVRSLGARGPLQPADACMAGPTPPAGRR
jgi:hypothetical protein